jgi:hypothetical protein
VGRASVPATFGGTSFQPVHRTGKMPVPPRTFQDGQILPRDLEKLQDTHKRYIDPFRAVVEFIT